MFTFPKLVPTKPFHMHIRKLFFFVYLLLLSFSTFAQQKVDLDKAMADNPNLYTGRFTRIGVGISGATFSYGDIIDGQSLSSLRFHLDFGKNYHALAKIYLAPMHIDQLQLVTKQGDVIRQLENLYTQRIRC